MIVDYPGDIYFSTFPIPHGDRPYIVIAGVIQPSVRSTLGR